MLPKYVTAQQMRIPTAVQTKTKHIFIKFVSAFTNNLSEHAKAHFSLRFEPYYTNIMILKDAVKFGLFVYSFGYILRGGNGVLNGKGLGFVIAGGLPCPFYLGQVKAALEFN